MNKRTLQLAPVVVLICACSLWSTCPSQTNKGWPQNSTIYYSTGNISGTEPGAPHIRVSSYCECVGEGRATVAG
jgi:hypothetical protein